MGDMTDDRRERAERVAIVDGLARAGMLIPEPEGAQFRPFGPGVPPWRQAPELEPGAERFGGEPPIGTVLRWRLERDGETWTVVGLRVAPGWYLSTNYHQGPLSWSTVYALIGDTRPCDVAVGWREIPAVAPEPAGDDAVSSWAARFLPVSVTHPGGGEGADDDLDATLRAGNTSPEPGQAPRIADPIPDARDFPTSRAASDPQRQSVRESMGLDRPEEHTWPHTSPDVADVTDVDGGELGPNGERVRY